MHRACVILEILLLFVLPIVWFVVGLGQWEQRLVVFEIFIGLAVILAVARRMDFKAMGFRLDNFLAAAKRLLPGTLIGLATVFLMRQLNLGEDFYFKDWYRNEFFFYYTFLGVLSQEFAYRGFLLSRLKEITKNPLVIIFVNASLFAMLHALHQSWLVGAEAFALGAYLTWVYLKQPNILATSISHGLIGGAAIILGFV